MSQVQATMGIAFQSTPSAWRETNGSYLNRAFLEFQSTPSAWRETLHHLQAGRRHGISIHSLRMEGDRNSRQRRNIMDISIHSLRMEGDFR